MSIKDDLRKVVEMFMPIFGGSQEVVCTARWPGLYSPVAYALHPKACFAQGTQHTNQKYLQEDRSLSTRSRSPQVFFSPRFAFYNDCS